MINNYEILGTHWFDYFKYLPEPIPPAKDVTDNRGSRVALMDSIRVKELIKQDQGIDNAEIPGNVLERYQAIGRPTPLHRASDLERYLNTPAKIFLKREDLLPTHSFKLNTSIAQAYYAKQEDAFGVVTETGAGQWGVAVAYSCNAFGLKSIINWVRVSKARMPGRVTFAKMLGAEVFDSPNPETEAGRAVLNRDPDCPGSIGTAIGDAISFALSNRDYKYISGSNLPHVLYHQTIIGLETQRQLEAYGESPDVLVACVGGGSNLGGFMLPFLPQRLKHGNGLKMIAAESTASPRLTKGEYRYDHADPSGLTPMTLSYTLGMDYMPPPMYSGGLRQHSGSPVIGILAKHRILEPKAFSESEVFQAGKILIESERVIPAPESCHAIKALIDCALEAKQNNQSKVIVGCLSGSGVLDTMAFQAVLGI